MSSAAAQATSGINGRVADSTQGTLPGVTVTITSPALQVPNMTTVTGSDGTYRFIQLPAGVYEVRFELAGFKPNVRQGIQLAVGFIATINPALEIGGVEETITVSGLSPVVDTTNTKVTSRLSSEDLAALPSGRRHNDIAMMTPGMMLTTVPVATNVGLTSWNNSITSGGLTNYRATTEGVELNSGGIRSPDYANVQEVNITQSGGTADVSQAGVYVSIVSKSGGNEFHGRYSAQASGGSLEATNVDDALRRQGVSFANKSNWFFDGTGDLGGRIVRDKLWFYGSIRERRSNVNQPGVALNAGPDGQYNTGDEPPYDIKGINRVINGKLSYQANEKYQFSYYINREANVDPGARATRFVPYESSSTIRYNPTIQKGEVKATLSNRLLVNGLVARDYASPFYYAREENLLKPSVLDLATQISTGRLFPEDRRTRSKWQTKADVTYLPNGSLLGIKGNHELKVGMRTWEAYIDTYHYDSPGGNYILIYDTIGGVSHQPSQIRLYNSPVYPHSLTSSQSGYITDRVTYGSRLTLNLGLRYDRYHAWVPEQTKEQGPFGTSGTFPFVEAGKWNLFAPRAGFAYNLAKDGKTVLKGTYGWFSDDLNESFSDDYNQNVDVIYTYRWRDVNRNNNYDPGEVNLALSGPDFLTVSGATNNLVNLDLKYQHVHELTGSIEKELAAGTGVRFLYIFRRLAGQYAVINVLRPSSAYTNVFNRRNPGPDGVISTADDGPMVQVYDFNNAFRGAAFVGNKRTNFPDDRSDHFNSYELTFTKRFSQKWQATVSGSLTQNYKWIPAAALSESPNEDYFPLNETRDWNFKTTVSYTLPFEVRVSSLLFFQNGTAGQRTYAFRAADPLGGPSLPNSATITLRMEPFGASRAAVRREVNLRLSKIFKMQNNRSFEAYVDAQNLTNSNTAWASSYQSGPSFGFATTIMPPRLVLFGGSFEF